MFFIGSSNIIPHFKPFFQKQSQYSLQPFARHFWSENKHGIFNYKFNLSKKTKKTFLNSKIIRFYSTRIGYKGHMPLMNQIRGKGMCPSLDMPLMDKKKSLARLYKIRNPKSMK